MHRNQFGFLRATKNRRSYKFLRAQLPEGCLKRNAAPGAFSDGKINSEINHRQEMGAPNSHSKMPRPIAILPDSFSVTKKLFHSSPRLRRADRPGGPCVVYLPARSRRLHLLMQGKAFRRKKNDA